MNSQTPLQKRMPTVNRFLRPLVVFTVALFLLSAVVCCVRFSQYRALKRQMAELQAEKEFRLNEIEELQAMLGDGELSREYVERLAREKLHLYYPDEVIFYSNLNG